MCLHEAVMIRHPLSESKNKYELKVISICMFKKKNYTSISIFNDFYLFSMWAGIYH